MSSQLLSIFGLRGSNDSEIPYVVFLATGFIPWIFFTSTLTQTTTVFQKYSYIIKNIRVPTSSLILGVLFSNLYVHGLLLGILFLILMATGFTPDFLYLQVFYYFIACALFVTAVGLITSSLFLFFRDTEKIVAIIVQFGFWLTPILWDRERIPADMEWILRINFIEYIVTGYRNTFLYNKPFYEMHWQTVYFWSSTLLMLAFGLLLFRTPAFSLYRSFVRLYGNSSNHFSKKFVENLPTVR